MKLTWMPPRTIWRESDDLYPYVRHWLVDEEGRILACVDETRPSNPEDSFDARLYYTMTDDTAYFISLEHAQAWAEKRAVADRAPAGTGKPAPVAVLKSEVVD